MILLNLNKKKIILVGCILFFSTQLWAEERYWIYTMKQGDNLWNISEKYSDLSYLEEIIRLNSIGRTKQIAPGSKIKIPLSFLNRIDAQARAVQVHGKPLLFSQDKQRFPVKEGILISEGSKLVTGKQESVLLEFADQSLTMIKPNTQVLFEKLDAYDKTGIADSRIMLSTGSVENTVSPTQTSKGTHHQVRTPSAIVAVRGTEYRTSVSDNKLVSRSEVLSGNVYASGSGKSVVIPALYGTVIHQGKAPSNPIKLLPPPDLTFMAKYVRTVPVLLSFNTLLNAEGYRFEIASDKQFKRLLFTGKTQNTDIKGSSLTDGYYWIRVRGVDSNGLEGQNSSHRFKVDTRRYTPFVELPCHTYIGDGQAPVFKWTMSEQTRSYHFQLSKNEMFTKLLLDRKALIENKFSPGHLEPGAYYWRVSRVDSQGIEGPFRDPVKCYVK